jgi:hypothetical protein
MLFVGSGCNFYNEAACQESISKIETAAFFISKVFGSELDDSLDTTTTLLNNWPASMTSNGHFVDGEDDFFDRDDQLERILEADVEAPEEIQVTLYNINSPLGVSFGP